MVSSLVQAITACALCFGMVACRSVPNERPSFVCFGQLIDPSGNHVRNAKVNIADGRTTSVETCTDADKASSAGLDLSAYSGLPGLIDLHTHATYLFDDDEPGSPYRPELWAETLLFAAPSMRKILATGVTTLRDLGAYDYIDVALRNTIASTDQRMDDRPRIVGPRMFVSGHGILSRRLEAKGTSQLGAAQGADEIARVIAQEVAAGVDVIKIYASTGGFADVSSEPTFNAEEIQAAVQATHRAGLKIALHAYGGIAARDAVAAGVDSIEHAADMDDATLRLMAQKGITLVPTVDHNRYYIDSAALYAFKSTEVDALRAYLQKSRAAVRRAHQLGVKIGMGSDIVYTMAGDNTRELQEFVAAGMTPLEAIRSATTVAAETLGKENELGRVAPGYIADLVAVEGDPTTNIAALIHGVRWVLKNGRVVIKP